MSNRQRFSRAVLIEIAERATDGNGVKHCEECGTTKGPFEVDHVNMDAMLRPQDKKRPLTAKDGRLLCKAICHSKKTKKDVAMLALAQAKAAAHHGVKPKPQKPIQSRGFQSAEKAPKKAMSKPFGAEIGPTRIARMMQRAK